ncbi:hypothetical protein [Breoghania sp. L-A4]|uniref:hypothetical protein n=1 Tax=Breoghania sp. L-A4 TaxID=2304600 RepID=UPI000E3585A6|nr:hypothetical protein [Breoghania sp. L-A4]AXS39814.1 hypothetical protein D1F64_06795 [Breoghania sp. L-A4]
MTPGLFRAAAACALFLVPGGLAHAAPYGADDARYVTSSQDPAVIDYVMCLEREVGRVPRNVGIQDAIDTAARACRDAADRIPRRPGIPRPSKFR